MSKSVSDVVQRTFAEDVARDLRQHPKQLQAKYLYDALGSSLFEAICRLPWYGITRGEARLLGAHAPEIVARASAASGNALLVVELGVGSGDKLQTVLEAVPPSVHTSVCLIDISPAALEAAAARVAAMGPADIARHEGTYEQGLRQLRRGRTGGGALTLFLGSNIGNFAAGDAVTLLTAIRDALRPGDLLLLGADLVKPEADLLLAYDDPLGVTAAFNRNLLVRINQELGGTFDLAAFEHRALWNAAASRVEMHLVSTRRQEVDIPGAGITAAFEAGETIWTESSYKYRLSDIVHLGARGGFEAVRQWVDADSQFALTLFAAG